MNLPLPAWTACHSAFRLDRWMTGELDPVEADAIRTHVSSCASCSTAVAGMRGVQEELRTLPLPPALAAPARDSRKSRAALAGLGVALAAGLVLVLSPHQTNERLKGTGLGLGMYVQHGSEVRRAGPGEQVSPRDAVRFSVTTPAPAYIAVLSIDASGLASIYFPRAGRAASVQAGSDVQLPLSTQLDETLGEERLLALFCSNPVELEPIRLTLEKTGDGAPLPAGCQGVRWSFVKR